ncbi:MAG TPA: hypothetical protein VG435_05560 [Acidimicrobiales bacterium]|jgi:hypothetical protein|nr:hypothetical protein [Acidimicrobiales bacterium]
MSDYPSQETYCRNRGGRGIIRTVAIWVAIAVLAMIAFSTAMWALGVVWSIVALLFKIALVTAVVAFVWRRITRRRQTY